MAENPYSTRGNSKIDLLNWIRFFSKKAKRVLIWPLTALIISAIGWSVLLADLGNLKKTYEHDALSDTAALSQSYAESLQRSIALVDQLMLHVRYENEMALGLLRLEDVGRMGLFPSPSVLYITLVDRNSIPQTSTASLNRNDNFNDNPVFLAQAADTSDTLYIGKPVPGVSAGQNVIHLSRRLVDTTGAFAGIVVEKVCCQIAGWTHSGKEPVPVSINVSHREFINADMVAFLSATLARYQVNPRLIQLELKEQTAMGADPAVKQELKTIQQAGIKLLIDNFGTGDLSISTLQNMAFNVLEVHYTLTAKVDASEEGRTFFAAVIPMAHALGMRVVAEGVETEAQARALGDLNCDELQGFYVSRPLRPGDINAWLPPRNQSAEVPPKVK